MTNPLKWVQDWWNARREKENAERARAGKTTSGHLSEGERQGMFREREKDTPDRGAPRR